MIPAAIPKIGVFFYDYGGRLSRGIDLVSIVERLARAKNVSRREVFSDWGDLPLAGIAEDLRAGRLDRVLWVGRFSDTRKKMVLKELATAGLNPYLQEWCDLEEQGAGRKDGNREVGTKKALILTQMALARTRLLTPLDPLVLPAVDQVLIIGAGVSGLHTAATLAALGKGVCLIDKESGVGGKTAALRHLYPRICDPHCGLEFALEKLRNSERGEIHTLSQMVELTGSPGNFRVRLRKEPRYVNEERCHACGECSVHCPVEIERRIPLIAWEEGFEGEREPEPVHTRRWKAIHPSYPLAYPATYVIDRAHCPAACRRCAEVCPTRAVELDQLPREFELQVGAVLVTTGWDPYPLERLEEFGYGLYPRVITSLEMEGIYDALPALKKVAFIQCAGSRDERHLPYCSSVCCTVTLKQVLALKEKWPDLDCYVFYEDIRTPGFDEDLYRRVKALDGVLFIRGKPSCVRPALGNRLSIRAEDTFSGKEIDISPDLLVLAGGMIPSAGTGEAARALNIPRTQDGFFQAHLACHPEESERTAIRVGGACRGPMNITQAIESGHRAAMDILPYLSGRLLVEPTYPVVNLTKCDKCKRCMEECPYQSFYFDPNGFPLPDLAKCRQCGSCVGVCPLIAVSMGSFTVPQVASQIQAIKASFLGREEPVILSFLCRNDAYLAAREAALSGLIIPPNVFFITVPCAGSINNAFIADALSFGIDGVLIAGCKDGQCHFVKGNLLVKTRREDLAEKLQKMVIEPERVRFESIEIRDSERYVKLIQGYLEELRRIGPNPFKR